jgi:hypothetical protein
MEDKNKPSFIQIVSSVVSAAFGVQSTANRERDFTGGSAAPYIIAGIVFTVLFIVTIVGVVKLVLG